MCGKLFGEGSFRDILIGEDPLCESCRSGWIRRRRKFDIEGIPAEGTYLYEVHFSSCLIQFKECCDEALKDVFLLEEKKRLQRKYRGYTICLMPSSAEKEKERGFHHLRLMYACTGLPMLEPFIRLSDTVQKKRTGKERRKMEGEIVLKEGTVLPEKLLLCDDVITTGATIRGALRAIGKGNRKIRIYSVSLHKSWYL
ncbi:MAG: hypothetical protein IKG15_07815 [Solobacterium sp.]|nr:hypothetical protein [Solobacterium sp.]